MTQHLTEGLYVLHVHEVLCEDPVRQSHFPPHHLGEEMREGELSEDMALSGYGHTSVGGVNDW